MSNVDISICVFLSYCLIRGIFTGFAKEMLSFVGILAGFYAACTYYPEASGYLQNLISDKTTAGRTGFLILFFIIFICVNIMGILIKYLLSIKRRGWGDRSSGAVMSLVNGVLIVNMVLIAFVLFPSDHSYLVKKSKGYPYAVIVSKNSLTLVSKSLEKRFSDNIKKIKGDWKN